ncbi:MAG TPA: DNA polymerase III subunit chi [Steroidobacteraceae bacterium]
MTDRVDFYVLAGSESRARLRFACRLAEKAYLAEQRVFVWCDDAPELQSFDELLWTFADRSFVPHEMFADAGQWHETPVLLGCQAQPQQNFDVLLNLGAEVPTSANHAQRIVEIVDALESRRLAGRNRFRHYRNLGLAPETHNIGAEESP